MLSDRDEVPGMLLENLDFAGFRVYGSIFFHQPLLAICQDPKLCSGVLLTRRPQPREGASR